MLEFVVYIIMNNRVSSPNFQILRIYASCMHCEHVTPVARLTSANTSFSW